MPTDRPTLGFPRLHWRELESTNTTAAELARGGAPHGMLVTADSQRSGRGRQGRSWQMPAGQGLLMSLVLCEWDDLLTLRAGIAVADVVGEEARVKWPNDVLLAGGKVAGVLAEAAPDRRWAVLGIGLNVALAPDRLAPDAGPRAATMGRSPADVPAILETLLARLEVRLGEPARVALDELRRRDALRGAQVTWNGGEGRAAGIDDAGRLVVMASGGVRQALSAGEVHLLPGSS